MPKQKVPHIVKRHIMHDHKIVKPGETVDLTADAAAPLIVSGHVEAPEPKKAAANSEESQAADGSKPLDRMNVAQLKEKAAAANVTLDEGATKKQILEALAAAGVTE